MRYLILDWSGVINDNVENLVNVISDMFVRSGQKRITKRELRQKWTQPYMNFYNLYFPSWTLAKQRKEYLKSIHKFKSRHIKSGMRTLLLNIKKRDCKLYVVTGDTVTVWPEIKEYGLENVFDKVILDSHDKTRDLNKLLKEERIDISSAVFVGDTTHEVECAKSAGIKSIAVSWGMTTPSRLEKSNPDYLVKSVCTLRKIFLSIVNQP